MAYKKYYIDDGEHYDAKVLKALYDNTPEHDAYVTDINEDADYSIFMSRMNTYKKKSQERSIENKKRTLADAMYSYYGANVTNISNNDTEYRAVMYPSDNENIKMFSTPFTNNTEIGNIIHWNATDSYWLLYERNLNELAFFDALAAKCKYYTIANINGTASTYASISMTQESGLDTFDQSLLVTDTSVLTIRIPDTVLNRKFFKNDVKIKVLDMTWKITSVDYITTDGITKILAKRDYDGSPDLTIIEGDTSSEEIQDNEIIKGPSSIVPLEEAIYEVANNISGTWSISDNSFITKNINNDNKLILTWNNPRKRKDFTINYGEYTKLVHVESLM